MSNTLPPEKRNYAIWLILLAAGGAFALTIGARQTMGLFLSALNTSTGLGVGSISLAFAFGQLWWGLTQPFAGAVADRIGTGRVILVGVVLVAVGTFITPLMTSTAGLIFAIGVLAAGGAGMAGPSVLMATNARGCLATNAGLLPAFSTPVVRLVSSPWHRLRLASRPQWAAQARCSGWIF